VHLILRFFKTPTRVVLTLASGALASCSKEKLSLTD
jgi:hypothetical protein